VLFAATSVIWGSSSPPSAGSPPQALVAPNAFALGIDPGTAAGHLVADPGRRRALRQGHARTEWLNAQWARVDDWMGGYAASSRSKNER
jgi:hypothetical protein